jgi:excisionase family DNA binding protein
MANRLLRIKDVADRLGVQEKTVRNWIYERRIDSVKVLGGGVRIAETTIDKIIDDGRRYRRR